MTSALDSILSYEKNKIRKKRMIDWILISLCFLIILLKENEKRNEEEIN